MSKQRWKCISQKNHWKVFLYFIFCAHYRSSEHAATAAHGQGPAPVLRHHPHSWWRKKHPDGQRWFLWRWNSGNLPLSHGWLSASTTTQVPVSLGGSQPGIFCRELLVTTPTEIPHQARALWEIKIFNTRRPWKYVLFPSLVFFFYTTSSRLCRLSHHLCPRNMKLCPVLPKNILNTGAVYWR